jgi:hypothetical protein
VHFFETLTPASLDRIAALYAPDAWFKDPFNEVRGVAAIERVFRHMFEQVEAPRFVVTDRIVGRDDAMLAWRFVFRMRRRGAEQVIRGATHLRFDASGRVIRHRDYWDAAEELYAKLPLIGLAVRILQRALSA